MTTDSIIVPMGEFRKSYTITRTRSAGDGSPIYDAIDPQGRKVVATPVSLLLPTQQLIRDQIAQLAARFF